MKKEFIAYVLRIMRENFSPREVSDLFNVDYNNVCAYMSGRKVLPYHLAFDIIDYLGCRVVVFRNL